MAGTDDDLGAGAESVMVVIYDPSAGFVTGGGRITPPLANVTFSGNTATYGGGMFNYTSSPTLANTILWGNTRDQMYNYSSTAPVTNSRRLKATVNSPAMIAILKPQKQT